MANYNWVFFDWDGTLVDSLPLMQQALADFLANFHIPLSDNIFKLLNGPSLEENIAFLKNTYSLQLPTSILKKQYQTCIEQNIINLTIPTDNINILKWLKLNNIRLMLTTTNKKSLVEYFLNKFKIKAFFTYCIFGDDIQYGKPDPEIYTQAIKLSQSSAADILVIEDSAAGVLSAKLNDLDVAWYATQNTLVSPGHYTYKLQSLQDIVKIFTNDQF